MAEASGAIPGEQSALDAEILSTETVPATPDDPNYPIKAGTSRDTK